MLLFADAERTLSLFSISLSFSLSVYLSHTHVLSLSLSPYISFSLHLSCSLIHFKREMMPTLQFSSNLMYMQNYQKSGRRNRISSMNIARVNLELHALFTHAKLISLIRHDSSRLLFLFIEDHSMMSIIYFILFAK